MLMWIAMAGVAGFAICGIGSIVEHLRAERWRRACEVAREELEARDSEFTGTISKEVLRLNTQVVSLRQQLDLVRATTEPKQPRDARGRFTKAAS